MSDDDEQTSTEEDSSSLMQDGENELYKVILFDPGENKMAVVNCLRKAISDLELGAAVRLADSVPVAIAKTHSKEDAAKLEKALEEAGAIVEIQSDGRAIQSDTAPNDFQYGIEADLFSVFLQDCGPDKFSVWRTIRCAHPDLDMPEAKRLVDSAPVEIAKGYSHGNALSLAYDLEKVGATAEVAPLPQNEIAMWLTEHLAERFEAFIDEITSRLEWLMEEDVSRSDPFSTRVPWPVSKELNATRSSLAKIDKKFDAFDLILERGGESKQGCIAVICYNAPAIALHDAKRMVEETPSMILECAPYRDLELLKEDLENGSAEVTVRRRISSTEKSQIKQTIERIKNLPMELWRSDWENLYEEIINKPFDAVEVTHNVQCQFLESVKAELDKLLG